ncbi:hypothetical protein Patl1_18215 [Pistacia atlantica]|uniref:Uncharacterized protein n=1 Tax=Pistacia atlantica TaxID=434234 RepID=A0ACC1C0M5_9ROSI|nr:hypothetical protein Patl1_18215 [Pistacia atlantica]
MASQDRGRALPKFGEWDVNNPATAEGFTVIFNRARDEKKASSDGGKTSTPQEMTVCTKQVITLSILQRESGYAVVESTFIFQRLDIRWTIAISCFVFSFQKFLMLSISK